MCRTPAACRTKSPWRKRLQLTRTNADYYALQLGNHVLGGGFYATRLYRDLREKSGLVYFVDSSFNVGLTRGVYQVEYACDPPNVSKARAMILRNLKEMQAKKVTAQELHQAKLMLLRDIPLAESSVDYIAQGWLAYSALGLPLDERVHAGKNLFKFDAERCQKRLCQMASCRRPGASHARTGAEIVFGLMFLQSAGHGKIALALLKMVPYCRVEPSGMI